jgi:hypothetical protein
MNFFRGGAFTSEQEALPMKLNLILATVAASALMGGAALAQATDQPAAAPSEPATAPAPDPTSPAGSPATSPTPAPAEQAAPAATGSATSTSVTTSDASTGATATVTTTTNGPIPDTAENRKKYGGPMSHAGKRTPAKGN